MNKLFFAVPIIAVIMASSPLFAAPNHHIVNVVSVCTNTTTTIIEWNVSSWDMTSPIGLNDHIIVDAQYVVGNKVETVHIADGAFTDPDRSFGGFYTIPYVVDSFTLITEAVGTWGDGAAGGQLSYTLATIAPCGNEWDKSSITLDGTCTGNDAIFTILNHGADMQGHSEWRLYVDDVQTQFDGFMLSSGQYLTLTFPLQGIGMRLFADQRPGHPGSSQPNAMVYVPACIDSSTPTPEPSTPTTTPVAPTATSTATSTPVFPPTTTPSATPSPTWTPIIATATPTNTPGVPTSDDESPERSKFQVWLPIIEAEAKDTSAGDGTCTFTRSGNDVYLNIYVTMSKSLHVTTSSERPDEPYVVDTYPHSVHIGQVDSNGESFTAWTWEGFSKLIRCDAQFVYLQPSVGQPPIPA